MVKVQHCALNAFTREPAKDDLDEARRANREGRFGDEPGERVQPRAEAGREDHRRDHKEPPSLANVSKIMSRIGQATLGDGQTPQAWI